MFENEEIQPSTVSDMAPNGSTEFSTSIESSLLREPLTEDKKPIVESTMDNSESNSTSKKQSQRKCSIQNCFFFPGSITYNKWRKHWERHHPLEFSFLLQQTSNPNKLKNLYVSVCELSREDWLYTVSYSKQMYGCSGY